MKFRKKPVVIEAIQWDGSREQADHIRACFGQDIDVFQDEGFVALGCRTLEGNLSASVGDWIIRGVKGEIYPCKPDIFSATYDPAE